MLDVLGNKVKEGDLLRWNIPDALQHKLVFRVVQIVETGKQPFLRLVIALPVVTKDNEETVLEDFLCARDPQSEALLDKLADGPKQ